MAAPILVTPAPLQAPRARRQWRRRTLQLTMTIAAIVLVALAMVGTA